MKRPMNRREVIVCGAAAVVSRFPAFAEDASVLEALSGDSFYLGEVEMRVADILSPAVKGLAAGPEPYAQEARAGLARLLQDGVANYEEVSPQDRWGRAIIAAALASGEDLAKELVAEGFARVRPETDRDARLDALFAAEARARDHEAGLWAMPYYRIRKASAAEDAIGGYHLIEGTIARAAEARGRVYLNFGADYRTDFTANLRSVVARRWAEKGLDVLKLTGARVRIRGIVERINGPSIELNHPRQIENLAP